MKYTVYAAIASAALAAPAFADGHASGDAAAGETAFNKCKACHMIEDAEGNTIVRGSKTGPNLYGIVGRAPGSVEDFRYSDGLAALSEVVPAWDEASFLEWSKDPSAYLTDQLGKRERSKMAYKLRDETEAADIWAYLASVGPQS